MLPNGTKFSIDNALYSPNSKRNLLSFKDIYRQGYNTQSATENGKMYLYITSEKSGKGLVLEKFPELPSGLHHTYIDAIESHLVIKRNPEDVTLWHDRLGHPDTTMMRKIIESSHGHSIKTQDIYQSNKMTCDACALGKLIIRPSPTKIDKESPKFLSKLFYRTFILSLVLAITTFIGLFVFFEGRQKSKSYEREKIIDGQIYKQR